MKKAPSGALWYRFGMTTVELAILLKPLAYILVFGFICIGARVLVMHYLPEGRLKRTLLFQLYPDDWS